MTRDEIVLLAKEADLWLTSDERIAAVVRFANLVAAAERDALRAAMEQAHGDWDEVEALRESLREHMAEIHRLRQWQGLTDDEIVLICGECAASAHRADDLSYARAIETRLKEKNT